MLVWGARVAWFCVFIFWDLLCYDVYFISLLSNSDLGFFSFGVC